jgi:hypothetical protein
MCIVAACSPDRDASGAKIIVGSLQLQLSAAPTPGSSLAHTILQLASAFVFSPHTLNLHSSAVATMGRAERGSAVGGVVRGWMVEQGQTGVAEPVVQQVRPELSDLGSRCWADEVVVTVAPSLLPLVQRTNLASDQQFSAVAHIPWTCQQHMYSSAWPASPLHGTAPCCACQPDSR